MLILGQNTYIELDDALDYLETYGPDGAIVDEASLAKATLAIDRLYRGRFKGVKTAEDQPLEFPRNGSTTIPSAVAQATAEMAVLIFDDEDVYAQPQPMMTEERVKIDVIETSKKYSGAGYYSNFLYRIQVILSPVLYGLGGISTVEVVRG